MRSGHAPGFRSEIGYQIFDQVWNRAGKITAFGLKKGKGFRKGTAHPTQFIWKYPPEFLNVSVHEYYPLKALITLEQVNTTEWSKKKKTLISKIAMIQLTWEIHIPTNMRSHTWKTYPF